MFQKLEKACRRKFSEVSFQNKSWARIPGLSLVIKLHPNNNFRNAALMDSIIFILSRKMLTILTIFNLITGHLIMTMPKPISAFMLNTLEDRNTES